MTKLATATALFTTNPTLTNAEFVKLLQTEVGLSKFGARTYAYNIRQEIAKTAAIAKQEQAVIAKIVQAAEQKRDAKGRFVRPVVTETAEAVNV